DVGPADERRAAQAEVVAVERDVERSHGQRRAVDLGDLGGEPVRQRAASGPQADQGDLRGPAILLEDLVGDAGEGPVERRVVENLGLLSEARYGGSHLLSLRASRGSLKGKARTTTVTLHAGVRRCQPPGPTAWPHARRRSSARNARAPSIRSAPAPNMRRPRVS